MDDNKPAGGKRAADNGTRQARGMRPGGEDDDGRT
jgi:hypothetical protein